MAAQLPLPSRLDTLPPELLRRIFNMAFSDEDEISECGSDCSCEGEHDGDDGDEENADAAVDMSDEAIDRAIDAWEDEDDTDVPAHPQGEENEDDWEDDEDDEDGEEGDEDDDEDDDKSDIEDNGEHFDYKKIVAGMAADPLNSAYVQEMAREQLYRDLEPRSYDVLNEHITTLQGNPGLAGVVERAALSGLSFRPSQRPETIAARVSNTRAQNKRIDRMEKQHKAFFRNTNLWTSDYSRPSLMPKAAYFARTAIRFLDFLEVVPALRSLQAVAPGLGVVPVEEEKVACFRSVDPTPITLRRLDRLEIEEPHNPHAIFDRPVLDTDGALIRSAPNLRELEVNGFGMVVSSAVQHPEGITGPAAVRFPRLKSLFILYCPMNHRSLNRLMSVIGPELAEADIHPPRRLCRPSEQADNSDIVDLAHRHDFTVYHALKALKPWAATSLTSLTLRQPFIGDRVQNTGYDWGEEPAEEDANSNNNPSSKSAMELLPAFTSLRTFKINMEQLDWNGAGPYCEDDDQIDQGNRLPTTITQATQTVADEIVAQLPPNIETISFLSSSFILKNRLGRPHPLYTIKRYKTAWEPRHAALAQALVTATRAGRFPNLTKIELGNGPEHEYTVTTTGADGQAKTRTVKISNGCIADILAGRPANPYLGVHRPSNMNYDGMLRPGNFFE